MSDMRDGPRAFYDELADSYHLLFDDWDRAMDRQGRVLDAILRRELGGDRRARVLDATCGIGTQALALAARGYDVHAADLSPAAVARADREARLRGLSLTTRVADLRDLADEDVGLFGAVLACDNALPHLLDDDDLLAAARGARSKLAPQGLLLASVRDYDALGDERPRFTSQQVFGEGARIRVVFQIWDWSDARRYRVHQFIVEAGDGRWSTLQFEADYRTLGRDAIACALESAGFSGLRWLEPAESGYYQPIVLARA